MEVVFDDEGAVADTNYKVIILTILLNLMERGRRSLHLGPPGNRIEAQILRQVEQEVLLLAARLVLVRALVPPAADEGADDL